MTTWSQSETKGDAPSRRDAIKAQASSESATTENQIANRRSKASRLEAARSHGALDAHACEALGRIARLAGELFEAPMALVSLFDDPRPRLVACLGLSPSRAARDSTVGAYLSGGTEDVFVVEDAPLDSGPTDSCAAKFGSPARFYAGAALTTPDGHRIGALCVLDDKPRPRPDEKALLRLALLARMAMDELALARAGRAAREERRLLEIAESMSGLGHWRLDLIGGSLTWSKAVYAIHGVDPATFHPEVDTALTFFPPEDLALARTEVARAIETGTSFEARLRLIRPDGALRHVVSRGVCERDEQGTPRAIVGLFQDVTDTVEAIERLKASKRKYRLVTQHAGDVITLLDFDGRGKFTSPAIETVLGYTIEERAKMTLASVLHPDDRPRGKEALAALAAGQERQTIQYRARHKLGHYVWMEANLNLVRDEDGAPTEIVSVSRDISDRKAMEAVLRRARADAEAAAAVKSEFLSNMSHELRTPLNAVLGFSRLIARQPELSPTTRRFVDRVEDAGEALLSTINDILDFSKLEAGQVEISLAPCDPRKLIEDAAGLFSCQTREKAIALEIRGADDLPANLSLARDRVRQVLLNLIGNAVKFTDQGRVAVDVAWRPAERRLRVEVRDTGPGIPADRLDQLFKRFSQIDGSATPRRGGTGLGLAICKGLVEAMGGAIGVVSQVGHGSCFWFELPAAEETRPPTLDRGPGGEHGLAARRVLIADDNLASRDLVGTLLRAVGAETVEAATGEAAVALADETPFDIILMDLRMPGMGGLAAAAQIRRGRLNGDTPILALSADAAEPHAACFDGAVIKPLTATALITEIHRLLRPLQMKQVA